MRLHPDVSDKRKEINCSMADIHTLRIYVYSSTSTTYSYTAQLLEITVIYKCMLTSLQSMSTLYMFMQLNAMFSSKTLTQQRVQMLVLEPQSYQVHFPVNQCCSSQQSVKSLIFKSGKYSGQYYQVSLPDNINIISKLVDEKESMTQA